jgi:hypothetical protein
MRIARTIPFEIPWCFAHERGTRHQARGGKREFYSPRSSHLNFRRLHRTCFLEHRSQGRNSKDGDILGRKFASGSGPLLYVLWGLWSFAGAGCHPETDCASENETSAIGMRKLELTKPLEETRSARSRKRETRKFVCPIETARKRRSPCPVGKRNHKRIEQSVLPADDKNFI